MSDIILQVENVSKQYRLGPSRTGSFRQDLQRWWLAKRQQNHEPFFRTIRNSTDELNSHIWALKEVSVAINRGEIWGVVGSNGSGKSTLLKIISRVIRPSGGIVRSRGTISSLLEAGTGFHQELTGRENIYVSGYMLGMTKKEIQRKFDEIVAFAGVEKFIDTPTKHYSSGMHMRLAFSVAAHLEPDILIIDEGLAVGDIAFQKKCVNKIHEVSHKYGRTILFVSHHMQTVAQLCKMAIWLEKGQVRSIGESRELINEYTTSFQTNNYYRTWNDPISAPGNSYVRLKSIELTQPSNESPVWITLQNPSTVKVAIWNFVEASQLKVSLQLFVSTGECVCELLSPILVCNKGLFEGQCFIPGNFFNNSAYYFTLQIIKDSNTIIFDYSQCLSFHIEEEPDQVGIKKYWPGVIRPTFPFTWQQTSIEVPPNKLLESS